MFYTYAHYKANTGEIFYIGKGQGERHLHTFNRKNPHWQRTVKKYGFTSEILANWETEAEAFEHEKLLIACFKDIGIKLTNMTDGGEGGSGRVWSDELKAKVSKSLTGIKRSAETKNKISAAVKGRIVSEATRKKMSDSAKRRIQKKREQDVSIANTNLY